MAACILTATTQAQWSKKLAGQPRVSKLDFTIDTFRFRGEAVAVQRYKNPDLYGIIGKDAHENRVALALIGLQPGLDGAQQTLKEGKPAEMYNVRKTLDEIKAENTKYDPTLLEKEIDFYDKFASKIKTEKAMEAYNREMAYQEERRKQKAKDSTEKSLADIAEKERRAADKKEMEAAYAARQKEEAQKAAAMTKKYGAAPYAKAEAGKLWIGMPEELVVVALGDATRVNSSTTAQGKQEEWLYYFNDDFVWRRRVLLRNHAVTSFQVRD